MTSSWDVRGPCLDPETLRAKQGTADLNETRNKWEHDDGRHLMFAADAGQREEVGWGEVLEAPTSRSA